MVIFGVIVGAIYYQLKRDEHGIQNRCVFNYSSLYVGVGLVCGLTMMKKKQPRLSKYLEPVDFHRISQFISLCKALFFS